MKVTMENIQGVKQEPSEPSKSAPNLSGNTSKPKHLLAIYYPWLLLTGLLIIPVIVAVFAFDNLSQVEDMVSDNSTDISVVEQPVMTTDETSNPIPLWMIIAIALSCSTGCLILLRLIKRSKRRKTLKPTKRTENILPSSRKPKSPLSNKSSVFPPVSSLTPIAPMTGKTENLVTVVPSEDSHPLDNEPESLVDLLDIRQESSLSTILRHHI